MNDLNGLDWPSKSLNKPSQINYSAFNAIRPTPPGSGRVSPLPPNSTLLQSSKPATPANDSFSNLVSFSSAGNNKHATLQDEQKRLADLRLRQQSGGTNLDNVKYAGFDDSAWNNLGSGRSTPAPAGSQPKSIQVQEADDDDDLFAVFNVPKTESKTALQPTTLKSTSNDRRHESGQNVDDDDDPFGLADMISKTPRSQSGPDMKQKSPATVGNDEEDDVLGLLGRPVDDFASKQDDIEQPKPLHTHPQDKAVADIVDMGFPVEKARQALETTESGVDVQAAVGWLLSQAHAEAQERSRTASNARESVESRTHRSRPYQAESETVLRRDRASTPSNDPAQIANDLGATFLKTAGSLWKQGQKRLQQAVQEFNPEADSNQPKWMRESSPAARSTSRTQKAESTFSDGEGRRQNRLKSDIVTDEALMLEGQRPEKSTRASHKARSDVMSDSSRDTSRDHSPAMPSRLRENVTMRTSEVSTSKQKPAQPPISSRTMLSRQAAEEQAAQAYTSSARRRKPVTQAPVDSDLLEVGSRPAPTPQVQNAISTANHTPPLERPISKKVPIQVRPVAPPRAIPSVSSISLRASHLDREAGNQHFKRGDYSAAHQSYSKSLSVLPASHPITIILLTNRALTAIKIGDPKVAVADSDAALLLIGPAKGESETIDLTNGDTPKQMRDYYGKALMRKAEALENLEKWAEAASVWREAVETGHGGATAIQGRQRAENAARPKTVAVSTTSAIANTTRKAPATLQRPTAKSAATARAIALAEKAAVDKLRAQNAAAERLDDEKFQLADSVDAKINNWRGGKQDNLRALLGSLDLVLSADSGWKKISMADLVLPNKVKIQYMKGIAKVHPDKIPTNTTTEHRMIAGAVFSTLNEAWDKFKKENNL